jgi:hypothetical protein
MFSGSLRTLNIKVIIWGFLYFIAALHEPLKCGCGPPTISDGVLKALSRVTLHARIEGRGGL